MAQAQAENRVILAGYRGITLFYRNVRHILAVKAPTWAFCEFYKYLKLLSI